MGTTWRYKCIRLNNKMWHTLKGHNIFCCVWNKIIKLYRRYPPHFSTAYLMGIMNMRLTNVKWLLCNLDKLKTHLHSMYCFLLHAIVSSLVIETAHREQTFSDGPVLRDMANFGLFLEETKGLGYWPPNTLHRFSDALGRRAMEKFFLFQGTFCLAPTYDAVHCLLFGPQYDATYIRPGRVLSLRKLLCVHLA